MANLGSAPQVAAVLLHNVAGSLAALAALGLFGPLWPLGLRHALLGTGLGLPPARSRALLAQGAGLGRPRKGGPRPRPSRRARR